MILLGQNKHFQLVCTKVKGATVTPTLAFSKASHFKVVGQSFICDGQGTVRLLILYMDKFENFVIYLYGTLKINPLESYCTENYRLLTCACCRRK